MFPFFVLFFCLQLHALTAQESFQEVNSLAQKQKSEQPCQCNGSCPCPCDCGCLESGVCHCPQKEESSPASLSDE